MNILIPFRNNRLSQVTAAENGQPQDFLYGAQALFDGPFKTQWFNTERGTRKTLARKLLYPFEMFFLKQTRIGIPFEMILENRIMVKRAALIFCCNDAISFAFLLGRKLGCHNAKLIVLFQSLSERTTRYFSWNWLALLMVRSLLSQADMVLTLSKCSAVLLQKQYSISSDRVRVFDFGADALFWEFRPYEISSRQYILSVGSDMNRDYKTLLEAVEESYDVIVVTTRKIRSKTVCVQKNIDNDELRRLYYGARLVVTPSVLLATESSGLSTTVQAMACGTPVLISDSAPMRERFTQDKEIFYFKPENSRDLRSQIDRLWNNEALLKRVSLKSRSLIESKYNITEMGEQLKRVVSYMGSI